MLKSFLFIFLILPHGFLAQDPSYESILSYVHQKVQVNPNSGMFDIAKKPDGFFICTNFYSRSGEVTIEDCQQIWDSKTKLFQKLVYPENDKYSPNEELFLANRFNTLWSRRYQVVPMIYYGYIEWPADTRKLIESKKKPSSFEMEALARSYFGEANAFIHPSQYGMEGSQKGKYMNAGYEKLPPERVLGFKKAYDKSLEIWEAIRKKYPDHSPNLILDLDLKIANEYMHGFLTMNCILEPELAKEYLEKAVYKPSVLEYAKMTLDECDKDAILLTNGDSDTYPLWYVQEKLGHRKDVLIFNLSLAQTIWYQELLIDRYQLVSNLTREDLKTIGQRYFVFNGENRLSFLNWLKDFKAANFNLNDATSVEQGYTVVEGTWDLSYGKSSVQVNGNYYSHSSQVFLYNVIASNPDRKIFATSLHSFYENGLQANYEHHGQLVILNDKVNELQIDPLFDSRLIKQIKQLSPTYFTGMGNWENTRRSILLYNCLKVSESKSKEIITLAEEKIIPRSINSINIDLAAAIIELYKHHDPKKVQVFRDNYEMEAMNYVKNFHLVPSKIFDELGEFKQLISIYTGLEMYELKQNGFETCQWKGSSELHTSLTIKLKEIYESCTEQNMLESIRSCSTLLVILHACELSK
jgi:hypothetical protein